MDFKDFNKAQMAGIITFVVLTICALLFSESFSFLQSKSDSPDKDGKCPNKCCKACSLNLPLVLLFAGGLGAAAWVVITYMQKANRDKFMARFGKTSTNPASDVNLENLS
jgi:hypothetical protein